jgi:hypothetical protein
VPSSTSNSNDRVPAAPYGRQWGLTVILFVVAVGSIEYYLRHEEYRASVKDTSKLWAYYRNKCDTEPSPTQVVALGASRMQLGFSPTVFDDKAECADVLMLPIDGTNCLPLLEDIANHSQFHGVLICSMLESHFLSNSSGRLFEYMGCHRQIYLESKFSRFVEMINTLCGREIESRLVITQFGLVELTDALLAPSPRYHHMTKYRYRPADYRGLLSADELAWRRDQRLKLIAPKLQEPAKTKDELLVTRSEWMAGVEQAWQWAKVIQDRGGRVVFVRFPTSNERWELDERRRPKDLFWDYAAARSPVEMIHFMDIPGADQFECPDTSHLNYDDGEAFTVMIAEELIKRGVLKPRS